ncbi:hypothetical protein MRB53_028241 [Persea americana]|uniref:Uncharacterized protein n=1 Tax=Persea americana TaxID=3435 RepID=A0ACC2KFG0_PERAE|nr:hypothetical protein MRB53_028241 [Persea americana]
MAVTFRLSLKVTLPQALPLGFEQLLDISDSLATPALADLAKLPQEKIQASPIASPPRNHPKGKGKNRCTASGTSLITRRSRTLEISSSSNTCLSFQETMTPRRRRLIAFLTFLLLKKQGIKEAIADALFQQYENENISLEASNDDDNGISDIDTAVDITEQIGMRCNSRCPLSIMMLRDLNIGATFHKRSACRRKGKSFPTSGGSLSPQTEIVVCGKQSTNTQETISGLVLDMTA